MISAVNGTQLFFERLGEGRPMLTMHGACGLDHTYFRPWLDPLARKVELIYYDHRGNGRSERPASMAGITHQTWIEDANALRAHLDFDRIILFGHSYGGFLAQEYALRFPDQLAGLILCATAPAFDYVPVIVANAAARGTPNQIAALNKVLTGPMTGDDDFRATWIRLFLLYFKRYDPELGRRIDENMLYAAAAWNHAFANCLPVFNTLSRLKEITVPTLVIAGAVDWITPPEQARRLCAELPNVQLMVFEESGHLPFIEEHDKFVTAVEGWMAKLG